RLRPNRPPWSPRLRSGPRRRPARWWTRCWNVPCVPARSRSTNSSALFARPRSKPRPRLSPKWQRLPPRLKPPPSRARPRKLPRIVRDLSGELGKQIELEMHGADTELDRQVLDLIKDPLTHMVRNSADHGLETPAERAASGKPEQGTIRLSAYHEGGHIIICIADNGRGLNTERIKAKAVANGLVSEAELEKMTEAQIHKFIFAPGFSTA